MFLNKTSNNTYKKVTLRGLKGFVFVIVRPNAHNILHYLIMLVKSSGDKETYRGYLLFSIFHRKKKQMFCLLHALNSFWEKFYQNPVQFFSVIPRGVPLPHSNAITILRQAREM